MRLVAELDSNGKVKGVGGWEKCHVEGCENEADGYDVFLFIKAMKADGSWADVYVPMCQNHKDQYSKLDIVIKKKWPF